MFYPKETQSLGIISVIFCFLVLFFSVMFYYMSHTTVRLTWVVSCFALFKSQRRHTNKKTQKSPRYRKIACTFVSLLFYAFLRVLLLLFSLGAPPPPLPPPPPLNPHKKN